MKFGAQIRHYIDATMDKIIGPVQLFLLFSFLFLTVGTWFVDDLSEIQMVRFSSFMSLYFAAVPITNIKFFAKIRTRLFKHAIVVRGVIALYFVVCLILLSVSKCDSIVRFICNISAIVSIFYCVFSDVDVVQSRRKQCSRKQSNRRKRRKQHKQYKRKK